MAVRRNVDFITQFKKLDPAVQQDVLVWAQWSEREWAADVVRTIEEGGYDAHLSDILIAGNERLASVFKVDHVLHNGERFSANTKTNQDVSAAVVQRLNGMKHAAQIVRDLGLTVEVETTKKRKSKGGKVVEFKSTYAKTMPVTRENYPEIITKHGDAHKQWIIDKAKQEAKDALADAKKRAAAEAAAKRKTKVPSKPITGSRAPVKKAVAKKAAAPRKKVSK